MHRSAAAAGSACLRRMCVAEEADPADGPPPPFETSQLYRCLVACFCPMFACVLGRSAPTQEQQAVIDRQRCWPPTCKNPWWWRGWNPLLWAGGGCCAFYLLYIVLIITASAMSRGPAKGGALVADYPLLQATPAAGAVAGSALSLPSPSAEEGMLPGGSWTSSCNSGGCKLSSDRDHLTCSCRNMAGEWGESTVEVGRGGCAFLENVDGKLACSRTRR
jgi:hypothetical protein